MNSEPRELTTDEMESVSGGTIILEDAAPAPFPPGPTVMYPPGPTAIGPAI